MLEVKRRFRESGDRTSLLPMILPKTSSSTQAMSTQNLNLKRSLIGHQEFSTIGAEALGKANSSLDPYGLGHEGTLMDEMKAHGLNSAAGPNRHAT